MAEPEPEAEPDEAEEAAAGGSRPRRACARASSTSRTASPCSRARRPARTARVGIVVSRFNGEISNRLLESALEALAAAGVPRSGSRSCRCPGAFELPIGAMALAKTRRYSCVIALGCVIRGETAALRLRRGRGGLGPPARRARDRRAGRLRRAHRGHARAGRGAGRQGRRRRARRARDGRPLLAGPRKQAAGR